MSEEKYFNLGEAFDDLMNSNGAGDTLLSTAKLLGKGISNIAIFGVTEVIPGLHEQNSRKVEEILERDDISDEQRERALEIKRKLEEIKNRS